MHNGDNILPKITVQYVDNESMELGYRLECREKAKYIKGTLKIHSVKRMMENLSCKLQFFVTSKSQDPFAEVQYPLSI